MSRPTVCIYHAPCADGFSAAWAVYRRFGNSVRFHAGVHGQPPPDVSGAHVLMVDFSYKRPVLEAMARIAASITVLDHHRTAQAELAPFTVRAAVDADSIDRVVATTQPELDRLRAIFDMNKSGAVLAWEYCHPDRPVPQLLLHVQDRDLWQFALPYTREIQACMFSYDYSFECWDWLIDRCESAVSREEMVTDGVAIERKRRKDIAELLRATTRTMTIGGMVVPVANLPYTMAPEAAGELAMAAPFAACYFDRADGRIFSLRSRGEAGIDVSAVAERYGGGGHRNAAGFQMPIGWEGDVV